MKTTAYRHRVRILPLGDSLTQGDGTPSSYRYHLFRLLAAEGLPFRFVGGVASGDWRLPPDCRYHSGRGGITTSGLLAYHTESSEHYIPSWAEAAREAEVVLLCIGGNDVFRGLPLEGYPARVSALLDMLYTYNPALSTVFVATVRLGSLSEGMRAINAVLLDPAFAAAERAKGRDVRILDFNGEDTPPNLPSDYPPDDGHPNEEGNRKLATLWYRGIADRIRELADTLPKTDVWEAPTATCESRALSLSVGSGERIRLTPAPGGEVSYLYECSDETVAVVDEDGTVYGRGEGECTVKVLDARGLLPVGEVKIRVAGVTPDVLDAYPVRHTPEVSEAGYTAPEKALRPKAGGVCVRYPHWLEGEIVTLATYPQDGFCIAFEMTAVSAFPAKSRGHLTLSLGDISLTFRDLGMQMTLTVAGRSVTFTDPTPPYTRLPMRLVREGGTATLYRGGVVLLTLSGLPEASEDRAPVRIAWEDYDAMIHYFYGLTVATRE